MNQITMASSMPEEFREIASILQLDAQLWRGVQHSLKLLSDAAESGLSVKAGSHWLQQGIDSRRSAILAMHSHILQE